jgi:hypothetical protein
VRAPIKLNRSYWPSAIANVLPSAEDPRALFDKSIDSATFTKAVSTFKFKTTFKTTQIKRFPLTVDALKRLQFIKTPIILDVGASDGITSLDVIKSIRFQKYFVTDLNMRALYRVYRGRTYFYDEEGKCILIVMNKWIVYEDTVGSLLPFRFLVDSMFNSQPAASQDAIPIDLINPLLARSQDEFIVTEKYDMFTPWKREKVDLVIAANILNKAYFTDEQISQALRNLLQGMDDLGRLAIVDNSQLERSTVFQVRAGNVVVESQINGGTEIEDLVFACVNGLSKTTDSSKRIELVSVI